MTEQHAVRRFLPSPALSALATALLLAVAMPGRPGWWPLLFVALVPLLHAAVSLPPRRALLVGLLAGFVYHACLLYWIVIVLGHYGGLPLVVSISALFLLALYMGCYCGLFTCLLSTVVRPRAADAVPEAAAVFWAPLLWVALDWLRSILFSGFPWMDLGYGLYREPLLIQTADLGGHHLLTFLLVLINCLLLYGYTHIRSGRNVPVRDRVVIGCGMALVVLAGIYSVGRFDSLRAQTGAGERARVAVIQGNIPQDEKWTPSRKESTVETYRRLTLEAVGTGQPDLVVWPETALPFYPGRNPLFDRVTALAVEAGFSLLTGAPRFTIQADQLHNASVPPLQYYNSALLIDRTGRVRGRYDKQHLVPFGEYVPLSNLLRFLKPLVESVGNFVPGRSGAPLAAGKLRPGVLICFESIFPDLAREAVERGANLLVNMTNDAWYGRSSAPYQSFAMSVLRAVETRRALVRAANTGISGFVTPLGEVTARSSLFVPYAHQAQVSLLETKSPFVRFGHLFGPACLVLSLLFIGLRSRLVPDKNGPVTYSS